MLEIPIEMLNDSFEYEEYDGMDRNQSPQYKEPITVRYVRIDRTRVYYRDSEDSDVRAEATIYCYTSGTEPFKQFIEQSKVTFDEDDYIIRKATPYKDIYSDELAVMQLEVI